MARGVPTYFLPIVYSIDRCFAVGYMAEVANNVKLDVSGGYVVLVRTQERDDTLCKDRAREFRGNYAICIYYIYLVQVLEILQVQLICQ